MPNAYPRFGCRGVDARMIHVSVSVSVCICIQFNIFKMFAIIAHTSYTFAICFHNLLIHPKHNTVAVSVSVNNNNIFWNSLIHTLLVSVWRLCSVRSIWRLRQENSRPNKSQLKKGKQIRNTLQHWIQQHENDVLKCPESLFGCIEHWAFSTEYMLWNVGSCAMFVLAFLSG